MLASKSAPAAPQAPAGPGRAQLVAEGVWQLVLPTPLKVGPVNAYLLLEPEPVLVDTGPCLPESEAALDAGLAAAGLRRSDVRRIIVTHAHVDHYGTAGTLAAASGATVYAHPLSRPWLNSFDRQWRRHICFLDQLAYRLGAPAEVRQPALRSLREAQRLGGPAPLTGTLDEGDELPGGWRVLSIPGHAAGHIGLFRQRDGVLIGGDLLLRATTPSPSIEPPPPGRSRRPALVDYIASLHRVSQLPVHFVLPGHGDRIDDAPGLIRSVLTHLGQRQQRVLAALAGSRQTPWQLGRQVFPAAPPRERLLVLIEILGHLEVLAQAGRVHGEWSRGRVTYTLVPDD